MLWSSSPKTMPVTEARLDGSDGAVEARQGEGMPPTPQAQQEPREQEMPPAQPCGPERADSVQQLGSGVGFSTDLPRPAGGRRASLRTSLEERATMERASSSSLKHRKPGMMTKATAMMSKKSLFDTVDNDGSGTIDSNEFSDLYNVVAEQTRAEMQKEQALKKKSKIMVAVASAMALFLALSVTTNFLVVFTVVDAQVKTTTDGEGVLVDKAGNQTVITQTQRPKGQTGIPLGLATFMNHDELMGIEKIMLTRYSPAEDYAVNFSGATFFDTRSVNDTQNLTGTYFKVTYMITGYEWFSEASMKFATSEGVHIWIVQGNAWALDDASPVPTQICSTDMECARFRVEGIDVDAVIARAELHAQGNHSESVRRALAQSGGECTDPTMLQERILAHLAQDQATLDAMTAAADIIEVESQSNSTLGKALRRMRRQMGEGPPQQSFTGVFDAWRAARDNEDPEVRSRRLEAVAQNRRRMTHSAAHASSSGGNANFGTSTIGNYILKHSWNALAEGVSAAAASTIPASGTSVECQTTDGKLQAFYTNVQTFRDAQDDLDGVCTELISASDTITQIKTDMETVESNLNTAKNLANVLKPLPYIGGVMGTVSTQCNNLKNNVQSKRIAFQSSSLYLGAQRVKAHAEDVQDKNAAASTKIDLAKESFQKYVENPVKVVDAYCSHYTKDYVCTDPVNDAIDTMNALFDQTLPDFGPIISPWSVFANWLNSFNPFLNLILGLSGILAPFNVIFNTQHCIPQVCNREGAARTPPRLSCAIYCRSLNPVLPRISVRLTAPRRLLGPLCLCAGMRWLQLQLAGLRLRGQKVVEGLRVRPLHPSCLHAELLLHLGQRRQRLLGPRRYGAGIDHGCPRGARLGSERDGRQSDPELPELPVVPQLSHHRTAGLAVAFRVCIPLPDDHPML